MQVKLKDFWSASVMMKLKVLEVWSQILSPALAPLYCSASMNSLKSDLTNPLRIPPELAIAELAIAIATPPPSYPSAQGKGNDQSNPAIWNNPSGVWTEGLK